MKEKTERTCPMCGQTFNPMTDALWKMNLFQHLIASQKHRMPVDEAKKISGIEKNDTL